MTARILIVDDAPTINRLTAAKLESEYYQVSIAYDGQTALDRARDWQPDVILLDVMMPGIDGYETCRRLKTAEATMHIPVVMITDLSLVAERVRGLEAGADDFLVKPVDFDTLFARLKPLVRLKRLLDEWRMRGATARALGLQGDTLVAPSVAGARALVVDDDDAAAQAAISALAADGIVATRARSAGETTMMLAAMPFDLVVLSLSMASGDPLRLASELRANEATQAVPLLLIADKETKDKLLRGFDLGANDWLVRPLDPNELRARVRNQIRRKFYQDRLHADLDSALEMALTDPLTGCYNQRYLNRHLAGLLAPRLGQGNVGRVSLLMIDVDHFKAVNDRFGHPEGDRALRAIADTLRAKLRAFDAIARYGGEEFAVVMPGTLPPEALVAGERLRSAIENLDFRTADGSRLALTISIGVAHTGAEPISAEALVRQADAALYAAKHAGRNQVSQAT
ncbi:MAG: PleD family two-component system response regulator [Acetobacteraceae bacterium]|nr:PleD family two-component system response regulator [Acetobacteraceae bacterium]